ncbi:MAG TPA: ABC transporter permease [Bacteroidota bacterium]|nr:ABC transporter permease [Bacteroidota bacterium]
MNPGSMNKMLKGAYTIWYRDVLGLLRDRSRMIGTVTFNVFMLVGFCFGLGSAIGRIGGGSGLPGVSYTQFLFPMLLCSIAMMTSLPSTMSIVYDREFGFMKRILVAPISRYSVAFGKAAGGITLALIQVSIFFLAAPLVGVSLGLVTVLLSLAVLILVAAVVTALGIVVAARQKSQQGFQMISMFVLMPLTLLTFGTALPSVSLGTGTVGVYIRSAEWINPIAYGMDALRQIMFGTLPSSVTMLSPFLDVVVLIASFMLFIVPGVALFNKQD